MYPNPFLRPCHGVREYFFSRTYSGLATEGSQKQSLPFTFENGQAKAMGHEKRLVEVAAHAQEARERLRWLQEGG
jgi:hypothetical protein